MFTILPDCDDKLWWSCIKAITAVRRSLIDADIVTTELRLRNMARRVDVGRHIWIYVSLRSMMVLGYDEEKELTKALRDVF